jgi:hypothetical protein
MGNHLFLEGPERFKAEDFFQDGLRTMHGDVPLAMLFTICQLPSPMNCSEASRNRSTYYKVVS